MWNILFTMSQERLTYLFNLYIKGATTPEERDELMFLLKDPVYKAAAHALLDETIGRTQADAKISPENASAILDAIFQSENNARIGQDTYAETDRAVVQDTEWSPQPSFTRPIFRRTWVWAAASVLLVMLGGVYFFRAGNSKPPAPAVVVTSSADAEPGRNGAVLILADGREVVLDSLSSGRVAEQNGSQVLLKEGKLTYESLGKTVGKLSYNTLATPNGNQFEVVLSDGTRVWLNAASRLTYPTVFDGKTREVSITGEVYFEVARNARVPFIVKVDDQARIEVLGTQFNVNAYTNENMIRTTLLEGKVKIANKTGEQTLYPGYQAIVGDKITIEQVRDMDKVMSWKNGLFYFNNADFSTIMRQFERWYDISVKYEGEIPQFDFEGKLPRNLRLSQVIKVLDQMGMNARLENRTLIISPQGVL